MAKPYKPSPWGQKSEKQSPSYLKEQGRFIIRKDRRGDIIVNHSSRPERDVVLQFGRDRLRPDSPCKEMVLDILRESERKELDVGRTVEIDNSEPRASTLKELWERVTARDYDIPKTKVCGIEIEVPVAMAVEALVNENPWSSGFHGALNQRWTIVFRGKISDRAVQAAQIAGLEVTYREASKGSGLILTDVSLPGVGVTEIEKAGEAFNRFAELYEGLKGKYYYREESQAQTAKAYAEGLGYRASFQYRNGAWELTIGEPRYLKELGG